MGAISRPALFLKKMTEFPSWKSLFFYRCTDEISFAPLRSQGAAPRSNFIREKTVATAPPPCSPKSIYVLAGLVIHPSIESLSHDANTANKLGIQPLREKAFEDIKKNVNANNVVGEVFSWVTAGWVPCVLLGVVGQPTRTDVFV